MVIIILIGSEYVLREVKDEHFTSDSDIHVHSVTTFHDIDSALLISHRLKKLPCLFGCAFSTCLFLRCFNQREGVCVTPRGVRPRTGSESKAVPLINHSLRPRRLNCKWTISSVQWLSFNHRTTASWTRRQLANLIYNFHAIRSPMGAERPRAPKAPPGRVVWRVWIPRTLGWGPTLKSWTD